MRTTRLNSGPLPCGAGEGWGGGKGAGNATNESNQRTHSCTSTTGLSGITPPGVSARSANT